MRQGSEKSGRKMCVLVQGENVRSAERQLACHARAVVSEGLGVSRKMTVLGDGLRVSLVDSATLELEFGEPCFTAE